MASPLIDASGATATNFSTTNAVTGSITTTATSGVAVAVVAYEQSSQQSVSGVPTALGLTFTKRATYQPGGARFTSIEVFTAPFTGGALTALPVLVAMTGNIDDGVLACFGVTGCQSNSAPFDTNVGLPYEGQSPSSNITLSASTSQANDLLLGIFVNPQAQVGQPSIGATNFTAVLQHVNGGGSQFCTLNIGTFSVSSVQSGTSVFFGHSGSVDNVVMLDAFTAGGGGATAISAALGAEGALTASAGLSTGIAAALSATAELSASAAPFQSISAALAGSASLSADIGAPVPSAEIAEAFISDVSRSSATAEISEAFVSVLTGNFTVGSTVGNITEAAIFDLAIEQSGGGGGNMSGAVITEATNFTLAYVGSCVSKRCDLWKLTRTDNVVFAFTSLDVDFLNPYDGVLYKHCASLQDTASESNAQLGAGSSVQLTGILNDESITDDDLYAGRFDNAYVEFWRCNWDPNLVDLASPYRVAAGYIGTLSHGQASWSAEVQGPTDSLKQASLVQIFAPGCRWIFGDSNCTIDVEALAIGDIEVTGGLGRYAIFCNVTSPGGTAIWNQGTVEWLYGANAGISCQVATVDFASQVISLWDLAPFPPQKGDIFRLLPGCPKDTPSCKIYNNFINFGGFPDVPGPDALQQNADSLFTGGNG